MRSLYPICVHSLPLLSVLSQQPPVVVSLPRKGMQKPPLLGMQRLLGMCTLSLPLLGTLLSFLCWQNAPLLRLQNVSLRVLSSQVLVMRGLPYLGTRGLLGHPSSPGSCHMPWGALGSTCRRHLWKDHLRRTTVGARGFGGAAGSCLLLVLEEPLRDLI